MREGNQPSGNARFLRAAKDDDVEMLEALVAEGGDVNESNVIGQNALHVAALWGHADAVDYLLMVGCDMDAQNQNGYAPLHFAAERGHASVVRLLVEAGADPSLTTKDGRTPAECAKDFNTARVLSPPLKLLDAIKARDVQKLKAELLASGGQGVERADAGDGNTPLHLADLFAAQSSRGADADAAADDALELVNATCGLADATSLAKALLRRSTKRGRTPLHLACEFEKTKKKKTGGGGGAPLTRAVVAAANMVGVGREALDRKTIGGGGFANGQWGKKGADGRLETLENEGGTALHVVLDRLEKAVEATEDGWDISGAS